MAGIGSAVTVVGIVYTTAAYLESETDAMYADIRERAAAEVEWDADWKDMDREQHAALVERVAAIRSDIAVLSAREFRAVYLAGIRDGRALACEGR